MRVGKADGSGALGILFDAFVWRVCGGCAKLMSTNIGGRLESGTELMPQSQPSLLKN
jgi:hypothetical protein